MKNGNDYDAVIVGCGPAGATVGRCLAERGYKVLAIEKEPFPRYHLGESLTGAAGGFLRDIGLGEEMERRKFPVKYGVKVIGRDAKNEFFVSVAPEPTWQVRRDEFDQILLEQAVSKGMEHRQGVVRDVIRDGDRVLGVHYRDKNGHGDLNEIRARFVVDCSGLNTYLAQRGVATQPVPQRYGDQVSIFTQIKGCARDPGLMRDNTIIFYNEPHHWAWFIPLSEDIVSVGVVVPKSTYKRIGKGVVYTDKPVPQAVLNWGLEHINPDLWDRCRDREWIEPPRVIREYSYVVEPFAGPGWVCVGDAHRFCDPIFSFGIAVTFVESTLCVEALCKAMETGDSVEPFREYQRRCDIGQQAAADLIEYFWRFPAFFGVQSRGKHREGFMELFAGRVYDEEPLPALKMIRESLARSPENKRPSN